MSDFINSLCRSDLNFLRCAVLVGILMGPILGVVGSLVVTRRITSLAGASAHAALGGVGLALFCQRVLLWSWCSATVGAVAGAMISAIAVGIVSITAKEREDTVIGVVWALGMSLGLLFLNRTPGYVDWQAYLFGNILLLSAPDIWMTIALNALVLIPTLLFYQTLLSISFDPVFAVLRGVRVNLFYLALLGVTAMTIVMLMNIVGIMLVIAMLTLPGATAGCFTKHLWSMMVLATVLSWIFILSGIVLSYCWDLPTGPVIVVLAGIVYVAALAVGKMRKQGVQI